VRRRVLHILSQRPALTGSGVTLDATVRHAATAGWSQRAIVGVPADDVAVVVGDLPADRIHALRFRGAPNGADASSAQAGTLDFPVPGMSDVMPYPSTVFSRMTAEQLTQYRAAWRRHVAALLEVWLPDVIHAHHLWLLAAMLKDLAPEVPVINQCHATGIRQMALCPHLAEEVRQGCRRNERFLVLHDGHAALLADALQVPRERIVIAAAGYDENIFRLADNSGVVRDDADRLDAHRSDLVYVGKLSSAKGLPQLLDAVEMLAERRPALKLHVAGAGAGPEADALRERLIDRHPLLVYHGQLDHAALALLLQRCHTCVLPSFYEGLPLVLVEAVACGCRVVATDLPGVRDVLAPHLATALTRVELPRLTGIDTPDPTDLPAFTARLAMAVTESLDRPPLAVDNFDRDAALAPFTWTATFQSIERVWHELTN